MSQPNEHPLRHLAMQIRYDLTAAQAKLTELVRQIDELKLEPLPVLTCPHCGPWHRTAPALAEHLYNVDPNRYPVPDHWQQAEARAADVPDPSIESEAA